MRTAKAFGERLQLARLRRKLSATLFADRVGGSRNTLQRVEEDDPSVSLGTYLRALRVLGLEDDVNALARDDELGRKLRDIESLGSKRIDKKKPAVVKALPRKPKETGVKRQSRTDPEDLNQSVSTIAMPVNPRSY